MLIEALGEAVKVLVLGSEFGLLAGLLTGFSAEKEETEVITPREMKERNTEDLINFIGLMNFTFRSLVLIGSRHVKF